MNQFHIQPILNAVLSFPSEYMLSKVKLAARLTFGAFNSTLKIPMR